MGSVGLGMRKYRAAIGPELVASSVYTDSKEIEFLHAVHKRDVKMDDLADCPERFAGLDKKMGRALTLSAKGDQILLARTELGDRRCQEQNFRPLVGRQVLWIIYDHLRTTDETAVISAIQILH